LDIFKGKLWAYSQILAYFPYAYKIILSYHTGLNDEISSLANLMSVSKAAAYS
jgi:hypothetical protein